MLAALGIVARFHLKNFLPGEPEHTLENSSLVLLPLTNITLLAHLLRFYKEPHRSFSRTIKKGKVGLREKASISFSLPGIPSLRKQPCFPVLFTFDCKQRFRL
jgi:hypothetical protein